MSNNGKFRLPPSTGGVPNEKKLVITLSQDGQVKIAGPIADKILCYGLLRIAEQLVEAYEPPPQGTGIVPVPSGLSVQ